VHWIFIRQEPERSSHEYLQRAIYFLVALHTKIPRDQMLPSKIQGGKYVTKEDMENGLKPKLPQINAKFNLQMITFKISRIDYTYFVYFFSLF
jgi:hypothetical protein